MLGKERYPGERSYAKPPIIEVICQVVFDQEIHHSISDWTRILSDFQQDYPNLKEGVRHNYKATFSQQQFDETRKFSRMLRFTTPDKRQVIQIGDGYFSVHQLQPYTGWAEYRPFVERVLSRYQQIKPEAAPTELKLKYVNKLVFDSPEFEMSDYLNLSPRIPEAVSGIFGFNFELSLPGTIEPELLQANLTAGLEQPDVSAIVLDLAYSAQVQSGESVSDALDRAHLAIGTLFEQSITEKAQQRFEEVTTHGSDS